MSVADPVLAAALAAPAVAYERPEYGGMQVLCARCRVPGARRVVPAPGRACDGCRAGFDAALPLTLAQLTHAYRDAHGREGEVERWTGRLPDCALTGWLPPAAVLMDPWCVWKREPGAEPRAQRLVWALSTKYAVIAVAGSEVTVVQARSRERWSRLVDELDQRLRTR